MTNKITLISPSLEEGITPITFVKVIYPSSVVDTLYLLRLRTTGITLNVGQTGVIILFTDGTKMIKEINIGVNVNEDDNTWLYKGNITLSLDELNIIASKMINKLRLYIYDKEIKDQGAEIFKTYENCIRRMK